MAMFGSPNNPKGPNLKRCYPHSIDFSGTTVSFMTPRHTEKMVSFKIMPETYNLYDTSLYGIRSDVDNDVPGIISYTEGWSFFGWPFLQGRIGDLLLSITVFDNPRHGSLFRPQYFEQSIEDRLYVSDGPGTSKGSFFTLPRSRINWGVSRIHSNDWAHYDVINRDDADGSTEWVIPISDEHSLYFFFTRFIFRDNTQLNAAYDRVIQHIMQSVTIDWSPEALRMQEDAKRQWPSETLSTSLPEIQWDDDEVRAYYHREDDFEKELAEIEARHGGLQA